MSVVIDHLARQLSQHDVDTGPDFSGLLRKSDRGRIGWRTAVMNGANNHGNWYMRYKRHCGKTCVVSSGFQVPRKDLNGEVFSSSDALDKAREVLHRVKRHWNELDMSGQERFDL